MTEAQVAARALRDRLWNPPNGRVSSELEVLSTSALSAQRMRQREAEQREMKIQEQVKAIEEAQERADAARLEVMAEATPPDEVIPVIPKFSDIVSAVCKLCGVTHIDLISARRTADIVRPRQIVMYLARHFTALSFPQIGHRLGGRDHTTVIFGVEKIKRLIEGDEKLAANIAAIKAELGIAQ